VPAGSLPDLIELLKANPDKYLYASSGSGGIVHMQTELFMQRTGTRMVHIPYKSLGEMTNALLGGFVDFGISTIAEPALTYVKSGELKALAVTSDEVRPELAGVPTVASIIPNFAYGSVWQGLFVKTGTPQAIIEKLNAAVTDYLKTPDGISVMNKIGYDAAPMSTDDFAKLVRSEVATWSQIIKANNIKIELLTPVPGAIRSRQSSTARRQWAPETSAATAAFPASSHRAPFRTTGRLL